MPSSVACSVPQSVVFFSYTALQRCYANTFSLLPFGNAKIIRNLTVSNLGESTILSKRRWLLHWLSKTKRKVFLPLCQKVILFLSDSKCSSQRLLDEIVLSPKFDTVKFLARFPQKRLRLSRIVGKVGVNCF